MALTLSVRLHFGVNSAVTGASGADGVAEPPTVGTAGLDLGGRWWLGAGLSHMESEMEAGGPARATEHVRASDSNRRTSQGQIGLSSESHQCRQARCEEPLGPPGAAGEVTGQAGLWGPRQPQGLGTVQGATAGVADLQPDPKALCTQRGPRAHFPMPGSPQLPAQCVWKAGNFPGPILYSCSALLGLPHAA